VPKWQSLSVSLPFNLGSATWAADPSVQNAAWELYIELATRVSTEPLPPDEGILREALSSLHNLFEVFRDVLRKAGPGVGVGKQEVGGAAIGVLNKGVRPFLTKWHPLLGDWEALRAQTDSVRAHEAKWGQAADFRKELEAVRAGLVLYANLLSQLAGVNET
jgi:hypothetical protein